MTDPRDKLLALADSLAHSGSAEMDPMLRNAAHAIRVLVKAHSLCGPDLPCPTVVEAANEGLLDE